MFFSSVLPFFLLHMVRRKKYLEMSFPVPQLKTSSFTLKLSSFPGDLILFLNFMRKTSWITYSNCLHIPYITWSLNSFVVKFVRSTNWMFPLALISKILHISVIDIKTRLRLVIRFQANQLEFLSWLRSLLKLTLFLLCFRLNYNKSLECYLREGAGGDERLRLNATGEKRRRRERTGNQN